MTIDPTAALSSLAPYVGAGGLLTALAYAVLHIARKALPALAEARKVAADASLTRAQARRIETQNEGAEVQRGLIDAETIATALAKIDAMQAAHDGLRARLDDCERKHRESDVEIATLTRKVEVQARTIEKLEIKVRTLGGTPTDMRAAPKETT